MGSCQVWQEVGWGGGGGGAYRSTVPPPPPPSPLDEALQIPLERLRPHSRFSPPVAAWTLCSSVLFINVPPAAHWQTRGLELLRWLAGGPVSLSPARSPAQCCCSGGSLVGVGGWRKGRMGSGSGSGVCTCVCARGRRGSDWVRCVWGGWRAFFLRHSSSGEATDERARSSCVTAVEEKHGDIVVEEL